jgi:hypothetical protein
VDLLDQVSRRVCAFTAEDLFYARSLAEPR